MRQISPAARPARRRTALTGLLALGVVLGTALVGTAATTSSATAVSLPRVQAAQADSFTDSYGVCVHMGYTDTAYGDMTKVASSLKNLGVRHVRDDWVMDNTWRGDRMRQTAAAAGVKFNVIMGKPNSPESAAQFVNSVATATAGSGFVESLEGANEWDISGDPHWAANNRTRQQALYAAAKANPTTASLPVLAPSMAFPNNLAAMGDMSGMADLGNGHLYPGGRNPSYNLGTTVPALVGSVGNKPIDVTETGYTNALNTTDGHRPASEDAAATYLPRTLLENYSRGVHRTYSYELVDEKPETTLTDVEQHFGLMRNDWSPKPAYTALKNLLALTSDPGASFIPGSLSYQATGTNDLRQVLLQKRDGTFELMLWRDVSVWDQTTGNPLGVTPAPVNVSLATPADVQVYRPNASASPVNTQSATTSVPLSMDGQVTVVQIKPTAATSTPSTSTTTSTTTSPTPAPTTTPTTTSPTPAPIPVRPVDPTPTTTTTTTTKPTPTPTTTSTATVPSAPALKKVKRHRSALRVAWRPADGHGAPVTGYQVTANGRSLQVGARKLNAFLRVARRGRVQVGLRAHNRAGWGPTTWSRPLGR